MEERQEGKKVRRIFTAEQKFTGLGSDRSKFLI
jgi:hypothetical protein